MTAPQALPTRLIGALFVERGLVSESQIRVALEIQRETGQQLGQVLVERFGVSRRELASVVAEQWAKLGGSAGPEDTASWRRLGEIFVERGFVSQGELDQALARQRQTGERLGEALVAQGVISKFELAGALAEQMAVLGESDKESEGPVEPATVHQLPAREDEPDGAAATPDNVVEFAPPKDAVVEKAPDTAAWLREMEGATVETGGEDTAESQTPEMGPAQADAFEAPQAEVFEVGAVEVPRAEPFAADVFEAPEAELSEDAYEVPEAEVSEVGGVEMPQAEPFAADVFEAPEAEASDVEPVEAPQADAAEPDAFEVLDAEVSEVEPVEAPQAEAAEPDASEVSEAQVSEVGAVEMPRAEPFAADAFEAPEIVPVEPEPVNEPVELADVREPQPAEVLLTDLRDAIAADVPFADEPADQAAPHVSCIAFAPTTDGYRLIALEALPEPGQTIDVPEIGERVVLRVGRSPIPADARLCAFVEETVTAPVGLAVH